MAARLSDYEKHIKALSNPKTPTEWELAMNNSYSPIFKLIEQILKDNETKERTKQDNNELNAAIDLADFYTLLFNRWEQEKLRMKEREREQLIKDNIAASLLSLERLQEAARLSLASQRLDYSKKDLNDLKTYATTVKAQIATLQTQALALKQNLQTLSTQLNTMKVQQVQARAKKNKKLAANLANVPVYTPQGKPLTQPQLNAWLSKPTPAKTLTETVQTLFNEIPDIFNKGQIEDSVIVNKSLLNEQFLKFKEFATNEAGELDPKLMIGFAKINRELGKIWVETNKEDQVSLLKQLGEAKLVVSNYAHTESELIKTNTHLKHLFEILEKVEQEIKIRETPDLSSTPRPF